MVCCCTRRSCTVVQCARCVPTTWVQGSHVLLLPGGARLDKEAAESSLRRRCCNVCRSASTVVGGLQNAEVAAQVGPLANANAADTASINMCTGVVEPQPVYVCGAANHAAHQPGMVTELRHRVAVRIRRDRGLVRVAPHITSPGVRCGGMCTLRAAALCMLRRRLGGLCHTRQQPVQTQVDAVVVSPVLSQKDRGLTPATLVGMLVQLAARVCEAGAGEQCATGIALHDTSILL